MIIIYFLLFCTANQITASHQESIDALFRNDSSPELKRSLNTQLSSPKRDYWLLPMDGGAERCILILKTLAELEKRTGKRVVDMFDGIAGTSIGGILAILLTTPDPLNPTQPKYRPQQLLDIFIKKRYQMFQPKWFSFNGLLRTKYKTRGMKDFLFEMLGGNTLKNRWLPTVVITHDLNTFSIRTFSSIGNDDYLAKDIAMATAAAPTYYKPQQVIPINKPDSTGYFVSDGGTCMNSPTHAGVAMLQKLYNISSQQIHVFSLGTGMSDRLFNSKSLYHGRGFRWLNVITDLLMCGQQNTDVHTAFLYLGKRYHRFNPLLEPRLITFDNLSDANGEALLKANKKMLEDRNEEFNQIAATLSKLADSKQARTVQDLSFPVVPQRNPLQNFFFWLTGWNRFQADVQLILRQSQTKITI